MLTWTRVLGMFLVFLIPKVKSPDKAFKRVQDSSSSTAEIEPFMSSSVGIRTVLDCSSQEFGVRVLTLGKFLRFVPLLHSEARRFAFYLFVHSTCTAWFAWPDCRWYESHIRKELRAYRRCQCGTCSLLIDPFVRLCDVFGTALIFDFIAKAWNSFRDAFHSNAAAGFTVDWDLQVGHAVGWLIISYVS